MNVQNPVGANRVIMRFRPIALMFCEEIFWILLIIFPHNTVPRYFCDDGCSRNRIYLCVTLDKRSIRNIGFYCHCIRIHMLWANLKTTQSVFKSLACSV